MCGKVYRAHPALARYDNETMICPDCGIREALASIGCNDEEQLRILDTIHSYTGGRTND